ncbi:hypothetical protein AGMMS50267_02520 [Spirochaetia bacterium]|nr:hypothetical protein AGMMS50267_02520 [Spirochaetia bacterium]
MKNILPILCAALLLSCAGLTEKTGQLMDGSAFAEKTIEVYRTGKNGDSAALVRKKDGSEFLSLSFTLMPTLKWYGTIPNEDGEFHLTTYTFFSSSESGWNEFTMDIIGSGTFVKDGENAVLTLNKPVEPIQITEGKILRNTTRITGEQALTALRNRHERITALTEWMHEWLETQEPERSFFLIEQKDFEDYWQPILLPETLPAKKRPADWTTNGVEWVRGEDIKWNRTYTEALLPEELRPLRDSGTLLRDWEEAADWIYYQFSWDHIMESLPGEFRLEKIK